MEEQTTFYYRVKPSEGDSYLGEAVFEANMTKDQVLSQLEEMHPQSKIVFVDKKEYKAERAKEYGRPESK